MPPDMHRTCRFSIADLRGIFVSVFERYANDVDVYVNSGGGLAALADQLDTITSSVDVSDNLGAMAYIMTAVTVKVFEGAPITSVPPADQKVDALTWKMRTELSVECAIYFAQIHRYPVSPAQVDHEQIARVMLMADRWERLRVIFEDSLVAASLAAGPPEIENAPSKRNLIGGTISTAPTNRQLSAESYANLRSQAFQRRWTDADILMLIEEHLRPKLNPSAVHYSDTISGEEWMNLYNWTHRREGRPL
jgi:hypothetical protein